MYSCKWTFNNNNFNTIIKQSDKYYHKISTCYRIFDENSFAECSPYYCSVINIMGDKIIYLVSIKDNDILSSSLPYVPKIFSENEIE